MGPFPMIESPTNIRTHFLRVITPPNLQATNNSLIFHQGKQNNAMKCSENYTTTMRRFKVREWG